MIGSITLVGFKELINFETFLVAPVTLWYAKLIKNVWKNLLRIRQGI